MQGFGKRSCRSRSPPRGETGCGGGSALQEGERGPSPPGSPRPTCRNRMGQGGAAARLRLRLGLRLRLRLGAGRDPAASPPPLPSQRHSSCKRRDSARRLLRSPRSTSRSRPARPAPRPLKEAARPARLTCPRASPAPPRGRHRCPPRGRLPSGPASARAPLLPVSPVPAGESRGCVGLGGWGWLRDQRSFAASAPCRSLRSG